jgi:hypothetical protein
MFVRSSARVLASALAAHLALGCNATRGEEDAPTVGGAPERLQELQPSDVAVAPVRDQTNGQRVPLEVFRQAFVETLIERRYSPLATAYVDLNWIDAAFRGTPLPDGVLVVAVTAWDPSHLFSNGRVSATADVVLFEGGDTTGRVLWQVTVTHVVDLGDGRGNPPSGSRDLIPVAVREFAREVLQSLPMRDPVAARGIEATAPK